MEFGRKLAQRYDASLVAVFGSTVKGDWTESSDVDMLVISDMLPKSPFERFIDIEHPEFDVQIFGYTSEEIDSMLADLNTFVFDALEDASVIRADGEYLRALRQRISRLKKKHGLKKVENGWRFKVPA